MLPRPCLSFTLPSVYDDTKLDCRVYHPLYLREPSHPDALPWAGHAAVVAHPYAPLGGSFDDPVVDVAAGTLLQLGFLVATFNFRGAASSEGRTSWTSKPEQADYVSVVGFLAYYVHYLDASKSVHIHTHADSRSDSGNRNRLPIMLFGGYSYGAMVTTCLPPLETILDYFATPAVHTPEADIRLRAQHLAEARNAMMAGRASPRRDLGVRIGGDEDGSQSLRNHDGRVMSELVREDRIRESVRNLLARAKLVYRKPPRWTSGSGGEPEREMDHCLERVEGEGEVAFRSAYLAVSPPVGVVTRLATMSFAGFNPLPASWMARGGGAQDRVRVAGAGEYALLAANPTLVVYGDQDGFISQRKMREWTRQLAGAGASRFRYVEVGGAGHFWVEGEVMYRLRDAIGIFATELIRSDGSSGPSEDIVRDLL
ncbi:Alpha/Beta hydrolase protein [Nemania sp. FL0031]|nr:Alpha/Beta hydrolase protein [Nemania sp. FL0031]